MEFLRQVARVVMTTRPGGFSKRWLEQCITMKILPLDAAQQLDVAQKRLPQAKDQRTFRQLVADPELQQLVHSPLPELSLLRAEPALASVGTTALKAGEALPLGGRLPLTGASGDLTGATAGDSLPAAGGAAPPPPVGGREPFWLGEADPTSRSLRISF